MKKAYIWLIFIYCFISANLFAANDYETLRKFLSARMYGEAYNELLRQELSGNGLDPKLKSLKIDLLDRTNEKLQKQAKTNPDNAGLYTILADIAFQKGDYDRASMYASKALSNNGGPMANYIFSKILFRKGNISQSFDQMSKVLEAMPDSPIIFNDFQFLYTCQQYGVDTARKLTKDSSFLARSTPVAYDGEDVGIPESPFDNDPTETTESYEFSDYNKIAAKTKESEYDFDNANELDIDEDLAELSRVSTKPVTIKNEQTSKNINNNSEKNTPSKVETTKQEVAKKVEPKIEPKIEPKKKEPPLPDEVDDLDNLMDFSDDDFALDDNSNAKGNKVKSEEKVPEEDPEAKKIAKAEELLLSARTKFRDGYLDVAADNIKEINKIYPNLPGKQEVEDKIEYEKNILKRYREALELYDEEKYDNALKVMKEAYSYKPKLFPEAPFYIGRCYLLKKDPDPDQALKYFGYVENDPDLNPDLKRDIQWTKLEIYVEKEDYEQANEIYEYFQQNESKFAEAQSNNSYIFRLLWWEKYKIWLIIGFSLAIVIVAFVFILQFLPDLGNIGGDPLSKVQKAFDAGNFAKAIKIGEKTLLKKQPIQLDRQIRELLVQAYMEQEDFEKVQYHARIILKGFPENPIAWGYLAKASVAVQDTSNEAVKMYEDMYRKDPSRRDLLPMLAHHYASTGDTSASAMEILADYHNDNPDDQETVFALAEGYMQNRVMAEEIIPVMYEAIRLNDKVEYHEFMARTLSKLGRYEEASRECIEVLERNINDIGIHVVYTSSMKKLKMVPHAIEQYKIFISEHPGNTQLVEIMNGLKSDIAEAAPSAPTPEPVKPFVNEGMPGTASGLDESVNMFSEELGMPGMDDYSNDSDVANFVEPIPESIAEPKTPSVPLPDFMNGMNLNQQANNSNDASSGGNIGLEGLPTLDPFAEDPTMNMFAGNTDTSASAGVPDLNSLNNDSTVNTFADDDPLLEGFDTDELPEELGGTARVPTSSSFSLDSLIEDFNNSAPPAIDEEIPDNNMFGGQNFSVDPVSIKTAIPETAPKTSILELGGKVEQAKELSAKGDWDSVIDLLSPEFASVRNQDTGMLLVDAWLVKRRPEMALEIIQAMDVDQEMMTMKIKDMMYKTAEALEMAKKYKEALKLYDTICNSDINYKDAFDRSDRLYMKMKSM